MIHRKGKPLDQDGLKQDRIGMIKEIFGNVCAIATVVVAAVIESAAERVLESRTVRGAPSSSGQEKSQLGALGSHSKTRSSFVPDSLTGGDRTRYWN
jgi:hypothetical protein